MLPVIALMTLAATISAQPADPLQPAACAERDALERDMEVARSKGQMLRRQRLEIQLDALKLSCNGAGKPLTQSERVDRQRKVVSDLERALSDARAKLDLLLTTPP